MLGARVNIGAIILADVKSNGTEQNKLLQMLNGKTTIENILDALSDADISDQVVVVGNDMATVIEAIRPKLGAVKIALNLAPEKRMASSVQTGIIVISNVDAIFVILGDQPILDSGLLKRMVEKMVSNPEALIVAPTNYEKIWRPLLFRKSLIGELMNLKDNQNIRDVAQAHIDKVVQVTVSNDAT